MLIEELFDFRLVGGTALSLLLGHRQSVDIDLFSPHYIEGTELKLLMMKYFPKSEIRALSFGITLYIKNPYDQSEFKIDLMSNDEFIRPYIVDESIRIANLEDIAAMKLEAITSRGEKKDYWDIAELLEHFSLNQMVEFYKERYPWNDLRGVMENLTRLERCENQPNPLCLKGKT